METAINILDYAGYAATISWLILFGYGVILWFRGIAPALIRLGNGLARRKIAIFAKGDAGDSLSSLLTDSKLFHHTNLIQIKTEGDIGKADNASVFVIHWPDYENSIEKIIAKKRDTTALVLYVPPNSGRVPDDIMAKVNDVRNATVVNIRGRLMNDIVLSMITTSYEEK